MLYIACSLAVEPTHRHVPWIPGAISLGLKQLYCFNSRETDDRNEQSLIKKHNRKVSPKIVVKNPESIIPLGEDLGLNSRDITKVESIML
jgi:hypothetical protein